MREFDSLVERLKWKRQRFISNNRNTDDKDRCAGKEWAWKLWSVDRWKKKKK